MVILFDQYNMPDDVFEVIFATEQQIDAAKLLIKELKTSNGEFTKQQMSEFANALHDGVRVRKNGKELDLSYNKRQFYDRILTPMKGMGLIDYDLYKKVYRLSISFTKTMQKLANAWAAESKR